MSGNARSNARGNEIEKRAVRAQERQGYVIERAKRTFFPIGKNGPLRSRRNDIFGAFDMTAIHATRPTLHVQVSTAHNLAAKRNKVDAFLAAHPKLIGSTYHSFQVWGWGRWDETGYGFKREERLIDGWSDLPFIPSSETRKAT